MDIPVMLHVVGILVALVVSFFIYFNKKGTLSHKKLGWTFVIAMAISVIASFWIQYLGTFSPIHLLSISVIFWLIRGIWVIRRRPIQWKFSHAISMSSAFIAIWIAGIGVFFRHYLTPGNQTLGFIASGALAAVLIPLMKKMTKRYYSSPRKLDTK
jgi:uncharacterized membrane protein